MSTYDQPIYATYHFPAADLTSAGVLGQFGGPAGKTGRLIDVSVMLTTGVTVAAATVEVGDATDADAYGLLSVPISAADSVTNGATNYCTDSNVITADTEVEVSTDGGATAGVGGVSVIVAWY